MVRKMRRPLAGVAQLVEQLICNQQVAGSTPVAGSSLSRQRHEKLTAGRNWRQSRAFLEPAQPGLEGNGEVPEWLNGADCKSAGSAYVGSNPALSTSLWVLERLEWDCFNGFECGCGTMVEPQPSKLMMRVRFPPPAPGGRPRAQKEVQRPHRPK